MADVARHTPGPWRTAIRRGYVAVMAGPQTDTKAVADCQTVDTEYAEKVANATLIAAAPDLRESLAEFVAALIAGAKFGLNDDEVAMLRRGEAALAKATGEG